MKKALIFGYGYTSQYFAKYMLERGYAVFATSRNVNSKKHIHPEVNLLDFNASIELTDFDIILISTPPSDDGQDPTFNKFQNFIISIAKNIKWLGYLSSTGVYGEHHGNWARESSEIFSKTARAQNRLNAEVSWLSLFHNYNIPVHIFRLSGIYGKGRNALERIKSGKNYSIYKADHIFSRIHVEDICYALYQSVLNPTAGEVYNLADDLPAPIHKVEKYACELLGLPAPKLIDFEDADLSPMAKEFFQHNKRVCNKKIKNNLGLTWGCPSYKEGLKQGF